MLVRAARPGDVDRLVAILVGGSREPDAEDPMHPERYVRALERIRAAGGDVLVAERDGEVAGLAQVLVLEHLQHAGGRVAEVESVHVDERHRRTGVGSALLAEAVRWATARGCYRVQLTSHVARGEAHAFYERCGFTASHVGYKLPLET